jgi:hypothetical protein
LHAGTTAALWLASFSPPPLPALPQDAYALDYADENFMDRDPTWMDRMNATIKRFCEVNGLSLSAAQGSEGGER